MGQIFLKYPLIPYPKFSVLLEPSLMKKTPQCTILTYLLLAIVADIDWKETVHQNDINSLHGKLLFTSEIGLVITSGIDLSNFKIALYRLFQPQNDQLSEIIISRLKTFVEIILR